MRPEKQAILNEISARLQSADYAFILNCGGLRVNAMTELRKALLPFKARAMVVKNSYLGRAAGGLGWEDISGILTGPTAMVTGTGDVAEMAKALVKFVKAHEKAAVKGACLGGKALSSADVDVLTQAPPRVVMLAMFVGTLAAPMSQLVGVFNRKLSSLPYVLKAVEEKKKSQAA